MRLERGAVGDDWDALQIQAFHAWFRKKRGKQCGKVKRRKNAVDPGDGEVSQTRELDELSRKHSSGIKRKRGDVGSRQSLRETRLFIATVSLITQQIHRKSKRAQRRLGKAFIKLESFGGFHPHLI
jgi:hypothetical protein